MSWKRKFIVSLMTAAVLCTGSSVYAEEQETLSEDIAEEEAAEEAEVISEKEAEESRIGGTKDGIINSKKSDKVLRWSDCGI